MQADAGARGPTMSHIELQQNIEWFWLASIVDAAKNSTAESGRVAQRPLLDANAVTLPVTGKYTLVINQGGVQNRDMPKMAKELFKETVLPYLMQVKRADIPITGQLELHLAEGIIQRAIFHTA
jgi:hypothetical protein